MANKIKLISALIFSLILLGANGSISVNGELDLSNLFNYEDQYFPDDAEYRWNDINPVTDIGATLGRVLFYDKKLSVNNSISCASCHQQENGFGDTRLVATGFEGRQTLRHPMRLINVDFGADNKRFWDERVTRLENLTTLPIQDTIEMGFSGINGYPGIDSLLIKLAEYEYYKTLFKRVFGDEEITEKRIGDALAQFVRSIIVFDSKFDEGYEMVGEEITDFPNFTDAENRGKRIFFNFPFEGGGPDNPNLFGAGCGLCHKAPSMDIIHLTMNNSVIGVANDPDGIDLTITRSPSLKGLVKPDGSTNGPFMHDGSLETIDDVIDHYNEIEANPLNTNQGGLLFPNPDGSVDLGLGDDSKADLKAFLHTLAGNDVYTNPKWSDPFDENGNITLLDNLECITINTLLEIILCYGDSIEGYSTTGIYQDTFTLNNTCDSIRILDLTILDNIETFEQASICEGEEYLGLSESGNYTFNEIANNGCDSMHTLQLQVFPISLTDTLVTICDGEDYNGLSQSGFYSFVEIDENGCDSINTLELIVLPEDDIACTPSSTQEITQDIFVLIQNIDSETIHGIADQSGNYAFKIVNSSGVVVKNRNSYIDSAFELDIADLVAGPYFLYISFKDRTEIERFFKI